MTAWMAAMHRGGREILPSAAQYVGILFLLTRGGLDGLTARGREVSGKGPQAPIWMEW